MMTATAEPSTRYGESSYRAAWVIPNFRRLVIGSSASQMGDWLYNVALLVYVFDATASATWVGIATVGRLVPYVLFGPIAGVIADRFDRVRVMIVTDVVRALLMAGITLAVIAGLPAQVVIGLAFLATAAGTPNRPAALATLPDIVGESRLAPANALLHTVQDVGIVLGPAIGAVILTLGSPALAFGLNAATFVWSAVVTAMIDARSRGVGGNQEKPPSSLTLMIEGLKAMRTTPYVSVMTAMTCFGAFTYGAGTVQLVVYADEQLGLGADGYGYLLGAAGLGGVLGATVSNRLAARARVALPMIVSSVVFCGSLIAWTGTSRLWLAVMIGVVSGIAMVVSDVVGEVAITRSCDPATRGRVFGAFDSFCVGAMVLGALLAPAVIHVFGLRSSMLVIGGGAVVLTLSCYPILRRLDQTSITAIALVAPRIAAISELGIFRGAPQRALEEMARGAAEVDVPAGIAVVVQGEPADAFYVVMAGELSVRSTGEVGGPPVFLRTLRAGDSFGEIGLIEAIPRTASVTTTAETKLLRIGADEFLSALTASPSGIGGLRAGIRPLLERTHPSLAATTDPA